MNENELETLRSLMVLRGYPAKKVRAKLDELWREAHPPRTVKDFVADMLDRGRTAEQILAVAGSTRWATRVDEVKGLLGAEN